MNAPLYTLTCALLCYRWAGWMEHKQEMMLNQCSHFKCFQNFMDISHLYLTFGWWRSCSRPWWRGSWRTCIRRYVPRWGRGRWQGPSTWICLRTSPPQSLAGCCVAWCRRPWGAIVSWGKVKRGVRWNGGEVKSTLELGSQTYANFGYQGWDFTPWRNLASVRWNFSLDIKKCRSLSMSL